MPKFVIQRTLPGAQSLSGEEWQAIAQKSNETLAALAGRAQWLHSYVSDDKLFCVYLADDEQAVREHATRGGFPCDSVHAVHRTIDPTNAEPAYLSEQTRPQERPEATGLAS